MCEASDEWSVKVAKSQKRADILNFGLPGPVSYALYFYWVHACHPLFNDYPQIIYSQCMEDTFLWFEIKIVLFCKFEDFGDACDVVCFIGTGCDGNIIHVFFDFGSFGCPLLFDWSKIQSIIAWKVDGELQRLKNITIGSHNPYFILNAALCWSPSLICTLLYPQRISSFVKMCAPAKLAVRSAMRGRGHWFLIV